MALRNLVIDGDPLLRKKSRPVDEITPRIIKLLDDMADTMYFENRGIGIAAPQVGVLRRVFIVDVGDEHGKSEFINPKIFLQDAFFMSMTTWRESSLSISQQTARSTMLRKRKIKLGQA